ncbi:MAG: class I SAM-dependent methyltransferase [bacterium]
MTYSKDEDSFCPTEEYKDYIEFAKYVREYLGAPSSAIWNNRTELREDLILACIGDIFRKNTTKRPVKILDVCCGHASIVGHILQSFYDSTLKTSFTENISYLGLDQDEIALGKAREHYQVNEDKFHKLSFVKENVVDLSPRFPDNDKYDIIIIANCIHEISPSYYPKLFTTFNNLLEPESGVLYLIDIETSLPESAPECQAIVWTRTELTEIINSGGWEAVSTLHPKTKAKVMSFKLEHIKQIDEINLRTTIAKVLEKKLSAAIDNRNKIPSVGSYNLSYNFEAMQKWIVATGTIARIAEEINNIHIDGSK